MRTCRVNCWRIFHLGDFSSCYSKGIKWQLVYFRKSVVENIRSIVPVSGVFLHIRVFICDICSEWHQTVLYYLRLGKGLGTREHLLVSVKINYIFGYSGVKNSNIISIKTGKGERCSTQQPLIKTTVSRKWFNWQFATGGVLLSHWW